MTMSERLNHSGTVGHPVPMWPQKWGEPSRAQQYYDFRTERIDYSNLDSLKGGGYFATTNAKDGTLTDWFCRLWPQMDKSTMNVLKENMSILELADPRQVEFVVREIRRCLPLFELDSKKGITVHLPREGKAIDIEKFPKSGAFNFAISLSDIFPDVIISLFPDLTVRLSVELEGNDLGAVKTQFQHRLQRGMLSERGARSLMSPVLMVENTVRRVR